MNGAAQPDDRADYSFRVGKSLLSCEFLIWSRDIDYFVARYSHGTILSGYRAATFV